MTDYSNGRAASPGPKVHTPGARGLSSLGTVIRTVASIVLFPWGLWRLVALGPRKLRTGLAPSNTLGRRLVYVLQVGSYFFIALPLATLLLGEVLITANERLLGEQADFRLQSDYAAGTADSTLRIPGPSSPLPDHMDPASTEEYREYLVRLYAPVIVHKVSHRPEWDVPRFLDFDGNANPRDNLLNEPAYRDQPPGVYGELTAETDDSYYLTYSLYHVKDYDHPTRQALLRWTYHDNDLEGLHLRVDKQTLRVAEVETWFHNRFLYYNLSGVSHGSEPVHGAVRTEQGTRVLVYAQPQGHGIRLLQYVDLPNLVDNVKVMRPDDGTGSIQRTDRTIQTDVRYRLRGFDAWYAVATSPGADQDGDDLASTSVFTDTITLGEWPSGEPIIVGRYIAGWDYYIGGWSRPKPMWSWDDGWDDIPIAIWHFYPSYSFASHGGADLSHNYLYNRPIQTIFGQDANIFYSYLDLNAELRDGSKWEGLEERGERPSQGFYWAAVALFAQTRLKQYVNYLFHALG